MFFKTAYLSVENSQVVADSITHLITTGMEGHYVLQVTNADQSVFIELKVRPLDPSDHPLSENADKTEMVQCVTDKDDRITIVLPHPKDRQLFPAGIIIPEEGLS